MAHFPAVDGLRTSGQLCCCSQNCSSINKTRQRTVLTVVGSAKTQRKQQVVLTEDIPDLGPRGTLTSVNPGYYRNFLLPKNLAQPATEGILANLQREQEAKDKAALQVKAKAKAMAIALQTINKFIIKKKVGESNQIFGSVTTQEVVDAIEMQTGRKLDKRMVTVPDIKLTGTYDATVKLHPEVVGEFKLVIQREKNQG